MAQYINLTTTNSSWVTVAGEKAPPAVPPHQAAQEIRILVRQARDHLHLLQTEGGGSPDQSNRIARARDRKTEALSRHARIVEYFAHIKLEAATRRTSAIIAAVERAEGMYQRQRANEHDCWVYSESAFGNITQGVTSDRVRNAKKALDKVASLAQSLPTTEDAPKGEAENILRAIVATLRYSGVPGTENLRWEEVIKNGEKKNSDAGSAGNDGDYDANNDEGESSDTEAGAANNPFFASTASSNT